MKRVGLGMFAFVANTALFLGACGSDSGSGASDGLEPDDGTVGTFDKRLDADMQLVIDEMARLGAEPLASLSVEEARLQPTYADAVRAVLDRRGQEMAYPEAVGAIADTTLPTSVGDLAARVYTPSTGTQPRPLVVYFHDGGFVVGSLDTADATPRSLANFTDAVVVSVDYRQGPEHRFPAAQDDAWAAYDWLTVNAASFGADGARVAVAGEGAGGNLAANVALTARAKGGVVPRHALLVSPNVSADTTTPSYGEAPAPYALDRTTMAWFQTNYFVTPADGQDSRIDLLAADVSGFPPSTVLNAEIDPLRSEGEAFAARLKAAGTTVTQRTYPGVTHGFFGFGIVVGDAADAMKFGAAALKSALAK